MIKPNCVSTQLFYDISVIHFLLSLFFFPFSAFCHKLRLLLLCPPPCSMLAANSPEFCDPLAFIVSLSVHEYICYLNSCRFSGTYKKVASRSRLLIVTTTLDSSLFVPESSDCCIAEVRIFPSCILLAPRLICLSFGGTTKMRTIVRYGI